MKIINSSVELIKQEPGIEGIYKIIELAGRTAYKSEDKIEETSALKFVSMLQSKGHNAALEHGTVYLLAQCNIPSISNYVCETFMDNFYDKYKRNPYSITYYDVVKGEIFVTTNYRVLVENGWLDDLRCLSTPVDKRLERVTLKFILSRAIANEFVRHRVFSFLQESTRYCNYSKDKFNKELTYIKPQWLSDKAVEVINNIPVDESKLSELEYAYFNSLWEAEQSYMCLVKELPPQDARGLLPLDLKTELIMTGSMKQWNSFLKLRCANDAHPDAKVLADKAEILLEEYYGE